MVSWFYHHQIIMNKQEYSSIIKKSPYHVFVFSTKLNFPINFAVHTYIVTVTPHDTHRREIHWTSFKDAKHKERHLHLNYQNPREWRYRYFRSKKSKFQSKLLFHLGWDQKVAKIITKIENQIKKYPFKNHYHFLGINSNSFIRWLLHENPELKVNLPRNAFGRKNFTD